METRIRPEVPGVSLLGALRPLTCQPLPRPQLLLPMLLLALYSLSRFPPSSHPLQAPSIISSGDLALTEPGMNLSAGPNPEARKCEAWLPAGYGYWGGEKEDPRYYQFRPYFNSRSLPQCHALSPGAHQRLPSSLWGSV